MKKKKLKTAPEAAKSPEIAKELIEKVQALRALATCHNLLDRGYFTHVQAVAVVQSLEFLKALHGQVKDECLSHADSDKVPELKSLKESPSEVK